MRVRPNDHGLLHLLLRLGIPLAPVESPEMATDPWPGSHVSLAVHLTWEKAGGRAISDLCLDGGERRVDRILAIARDVLSASDITADDDLVDRGGTSLSIVRIVAVASRALDLDIDPRHLDGTVTVRNLARVARPTGTSP